MYVLALINSKLLFLCLQSISNVFRGGYITCTKQYFRELPIQQIQFGMDDEDRESVVDEYLNDYARGLEGHSFGEMIGNLRDHLRSEEEGVVHDVLVRLAQEMSGMNNQKYDLNLSLRDHLGSYSDDQTLAEVGLTQPPDGASESILTETTETRPNLRVGEATVVRESPTSVEIRLTARYKPDDEDAHETDQWGYTETEPLAALEITDLTEAEADLIEHFVPVAVEEAGGFADFRETATKTNSLVDRLRKLTLPAVNDVRDGLASYIETKERADELEAKIDRTDDLIDEIVYELYGLTDEEIEIVEEAVGE